MTTNTEPRSYRAAACLASIAAAAVTLVRFPEHRKGASPPPPLMVAFAAIARPQGSSSSAV